MQAQRVAVDSQLQSATRLHLDLACVKLTNTEVKLNDTEANLNDTEAKLNDTEARLNDTEAKLNKTDAKLNDTNINLNETEKKLDATRKIVEKLDTRIFTWKINNFSEILRLHVARTGINPRKDNVPFYTDRKESYGYKLKVRVYLLTFAVHCCNER